MSKMRLSDDSNHSVLLDQFLDKVEGLAFATSKKKISILDWAKSIVLGSKPFQIEGHEYEVEMLGCDAPRQIYKKGAQLGMTEEALILVETVLLAP